MGSNQDRAWAIVLMLMFWLLGLTASSWAQTARLWSLETQLRHHQMIHGQQEALQQLIDDGVVPEGSRLSEDLTHESQRTGSSAH